MKNQKIIDMIDEEMEKVDKLMEERDYDTAACNLSDLVLIIREELYRKVKNKKEEN